MAENDTQKTKVVSPPKRRKKPSAKAARGPEVNPGAAPAPAEPALLVARRWAGRLVVPVFGALPLACAAAVRYGGEIPSDVWAALFVGLGGVLGAVVKWLLGNGEGRRP